MTLLRGVGELHVKDGSRIEISCEIANFPRPVTFVTWYKDGLVSKIEREEGEKGPCTSSSENLQTGSLHVVDFWTTWDHKSSWFAGKYELQVPAKE